LKAARFVLWTVWGPTGMPWLQDSKHNTPTYTTQLVSPFAQWHEQMHVNHAVIQSLCNSDSLNEPSNRIDPLHQIQSMLSFNTLYRKPWQINPSNYLNLVSTDKVFVTFDIYRSSRRMHGHVTLHQKLIFMMDRIVVQYYIRLIDSHAFEMLCELSYSVGDMKIQEPTEVMCWKYMPIDSIQCRFRSIFNITIQEKKFLNLQNTKIIATQKAQVEHWIKTQFWTLLRIVPPTESHVEVFAEKSVVNNLVFTVWMSTQMK